MYRNTFAWFYFCLAHCTYEQLKHVAHRVLWVQPITRDKQSSSKTREIIIGKKIIGVTNRANLENPPLRFVQITKCDLTLKRSKKLFDWGIMQNHETMYWCKYEKITICEMILHSRSVKQNFWSFRGHLVIIQNQTSRGVFVNYPKNTNPSYLSESRADPSSKSSSTTSGSQYSSLPLWEDDSEGFFRNMALKTRFPCFFGGTFGGSGFSEGCISTTIQVVSSRRPLTCTASCKYEKGEIGKPNTRWDQVKISKV